MRKGIRRAFARRHLNAATRVNRSVLYTAISGPILTDLVAGRLIRVSTFLTRLGLDADFIHRYGSPAGRHIAKAYRKLTGAEPTRCWIQNDAGRYIHVAVYAPGHEALPAGASTYPRTRALALAVAA